MSSLASIIIPAYNAERWIGEAVHSALSQTWSDIEVIVVDDGSQDHTAAAVAPLIGDRVRLLRQKNQGASAARNAGLRASRGSYIQFLDADDLLHSDKVAAQMRVLQSAGDTVLASGYWTRFEANPATAPFRHEALSRDLTGVEFIQLQFETVGMMHPAAWLAPRMLVDQAGGWNEELTLNDDGEYFARLALRASRIVFCPGARSYYRSNLRGSLSGRRDPRALRSQFRSIELVTSHLLNSDRSDRSRSAAAFAWKWTAYELYPELPELSRECEARCKALGGSSRPLPVTRGFRLISTLLGWRAAKRFRAAWRAVSARSLRS